ncbi:unnamed protein product, partial [Closterium sp. NIES-54]
LGAARGVAFGVSASGGAPYGGAEPASAKPGGAEPEGAEPGGAAFEGAESRGTEPGGAEPRGTEPEGAEPGGAASEAAESGGAEPRGNASAGVPGAGGSAAGGTGAGGAGAAGPGGARTSCTRATRAGGVGGAGAGDPGAGGIGAGGTGAGGAGAGGTHAGGARAGGTRAGDSGAGDIGAGGAGAGGAGAGDPGAGRTRAGGAGAGGAGAGGTGVGDPGAGGACGGGAGAGGTGARGNVQRRLFFVPPPPSSLPPPDSVLRQPDSPLPAPSPYAEQTNYFTERREPESRLATHVHAVRTGQRFPRPCPPPIPGTHIMGLRLSSSTAASALVAGLVDFFAACRLHYPTSLVAEYVSDCPPSVGGGCALGKDVLEDRQEDFECLAAAVPHLVAMLLAPEGDPDAPDIPAPRSYAEAITGPYSSHWQTDMDEEMASWKSTSTYVDAVPPPGANIVDGMWIFRVKRPPGSPPVFKARYVVQGFSQRYGDAFFQTFSPTPKMTTLRVLLHVAAQRDYELHSLDFSTAFLQGNLH